MRGVIYKTIDGGETWENMSSATRNYLWSVYFTDHNGVWVAGDFGSILHKMDSTTTTGLMNLHTREISALLYPNPVQEKMNIKIVNEDLLPVYIKIYNAEGHLLETIHDLHIPVKEKMIVYDCSGLPSGIYFLRIRVGDQMNSKKFIGL